MKPIAGLANPVALLEGRRYFLRLSKRGERIPLFTLVTLVAYTPCPAVVVVRDARRHYLRCSRGDLYGLG